MEVGARFRDLPADCPLSVPFSTDPKGLAFVSAWGIRRIFSAFAAFALILSDYAVAASALGVSSRFAYYRLYITIQKGLLRSTRQSVPANIPIIASHEVMYCFTLLSTFALMTAFAGNIKVIVEKLTTAFDNRIIVCVFDFI